ncbi:MAG: PAS domain-containing protein [Hyphomonadaceae bacterium]
MQDVAYVIPPSLVPVGPLDFLASVSDKIEGFFYRCLNDSDYTMLHLSSGFDRMLGHDSAGFVLKQRSFADLIHPEDLEAVTAAINTAVAQRERWRISYRLRRADLSYAPVFETGGGVFDPGGGALLYLDGVVLDVGRLG